MTKLERLMAAISGEAVDRVPVALWRHFPGDDQRAEDLAAATLWFQSHHDWDFIKVSPASSFCLVDWGVADEWTGGDEGTRSYTRRAIQEPQDWLGLPVLDPTTGRLGEQLRCLDMIRAGAPQGVPWIQTVFSPLAQARNLAGVDRLMEHIRLHPGQVHAGLETITRTTVKFVAACLPLGIAGIYYAMQLASTSQLTEAEYARLGEPYDRRVLSAVRECWFTMLHLHGSDVMFDLAARYPVQAINWHDRETRPSLKEGKARFAGAVCGGLARWDDLLKAEPDRVREQIADAIAQTGGRRLIVASGCVAPVTAPLSNLRAVREAVEVT